jgi:peptide-methionine (S)-S-oxide reductase
MGTDADATPTRPGFEPIYARAKLRPDLAAGGQPGMIAPMTMQRLLLLLGEFVLLFAPVNANESKTEFLVLGGGCFWCTEASYELLPGVKDVVSGYAGGQRPNPTYKEIGTGRTGHAEVIRIEYDPAQVSLESLLEFFWLVHDPTTMNRQGADVGPQYRSIILYAGDAQREAAERSRVRAQEDFSRPIVTQIEPLTTFWPAEDYHQDYFRKNPTQAYCQAVIAPKVRKLERKIQSGR